MLVEVAPRTDHRMRIGIVRGDLGAAGGAERYALGLIRQLVARGDEVHVFSAQVPEELVPEVHVHRFQMPRKLVRPPRYFRQQAFEKWLHRERQNCELDLVFTLERIWPSHVFRAGDGVHRAWLEICGREMNTSRRWIMQSQPFHRRVLQSEKQVFDPQHTQVVVCNSQMVANEVARIYRFPAAQLRVVPNGVDENYFQPALPELREQLRFDRGVQTGELMLLFVGSGFWRKGVDRALQILSQWKWLGLARPVKLFVVGKDNLESYRQMARGLGVEELVNFVGSVAPQEVLQWYQCADLFLFPTRYDPFANVCLESSACGVPVVTTTANGFSEHVQNGVNGWILADNATPETWAQQLKAWCEKLAPSESVRQAVAHLTLEKHLQHLQRVIDTCREESTL
jgi:UDP-glucose:(heptosyl)LPS alpha-1,3-glucosyltransferase